MNRLILTFKNILYKFSAHIPNTFQLYGGLHASSREMLSYCKRVTFFCVTLVLR